MPAKKRSPEETRTLQRATRDRRAAREKIQYACAQANLQARKLTMHEVRDISARHERGEEYRTTGKAYGLDEFTVARVVRYGKLSPWQHAEAARDARRVPLQQAWASMHKKDQLPAS